jgi:hypothetical protein
MSFASVRQLLFLDVAFELRDPMVTDRFKFPDLLSSSFDHAFEALSANNHVAPRNWTSSEKRYVYRQLSDDDREPFRRAVSTVHFISLECLRKLKFDDYEILDAEVSELEFGCAKGRIVYVLTAVAGATAFTVNATVLFDRFDPPVTKIECESQITYSDEVSRNIKDVIATNPQAFLDPNNKECVLLRQEALNQVGYNLSKSGVRRNNMAAIEQQAQTRFGVNNNEELYKRIANHLSNEKEKIISMKITIIM